MPRNNASHNDAAVQRASAARQAGVAMLVHAALRRQITASLQQQVANAATAADTGATLQEPTAYLDKAMAIRTTPIKQPTFVNLDARPLHGGAAEFVPAQKMHEVVKRTTFLDLPLPVLAQIIRELDSRQNIKLRASYYDQELRRKILNRLVSTFESFSVASKQLRQLAWWTAYIVIASIPRPFRLDVATPIRPLLLSVIPQTFKHLQTLSLRLPVLDASCERGLACMYLSHVASLLGTAIQEAPGLDVITVQITSRPDFEHLDTYLYHIYDVVYDIYDLCDANCTCEMRPVLLTYTYREKFHEDLEIYVVLDEIFAGVTADDVYCTWCPCPKWHADCDIDSHSKSVGLGSRIQREMHRRILRPKIKRGRPAYRHGTFTISVGPRRLAHHPVLAATGRRLPMKNHK